MVELQPSKLITWVRFPSPAPIFAGVAELADARDLKSLEEWSSYRFDSGLRHHFFCYAVVAEWQTRQLQALVGATLWRFKSSLPHHVKIIYAVVVELADTLLWGGSARLGVWVQVSSTAPFLKLYTTLAVVVELADTLLWGGSARLGVWVQVSSTAPT